jgi:opine dehydrogenase
MRVGIVGAGAIACAAAALLLKAGHEVLIWSPSGKRITGLGAVMPLRVSGAVNGDFSVRVAESCAAVFADAAAVVFALPASGHKQVFDEAAPHVRAGQTLIISSHLSFGGLYLSKLLSRHGTRVTIVALATTVCTAKQKTSTSLNIGAIRREVGMGTIPAGDGNQAHTLCTELFGNRFVQQEGLLATSLSNVNPLSHLAIALLNLTRMENGEDWSQAGNVTTSVGRLIESLDSERIAIAEAFGLRIRTVREHISLSYNLPQGTVAEMNAARHRQGLGVAGPKTLESRYVLEDVPFGLVPTVLLGRLAERRPLLHEAGLHLLSATYGRDFQKENNLLSEIGLEDMSAEQLVCLCQAGY